MQSITVALETESGEVLSRFEDGRSIDLRIVTDAPESSSCIRFIDPYGNLVINRYQLPVLIADLEELLGSVSDPDYQQNIRKLLDFLAGDMAKQPHVYVKFCGD